MSILNRKLLLIIAFFTAGVFLYQYSPFISLLLFPLSLISLKFSKKQALTFILASLMFFAGGMYTLLTEHSNYQKTKTIVGKECEIKGTVISLPQSESYGQSAFCLTKYGKIRLMTSNPILQYKDEITFRAKCYYPEEKSRPLSFDYPLYLKGSGIYLMAFAEDLEVNSNSFSYLNPFDATISLRALLAEKADSLWSGETLMFARSILLGDTSLSTYEFKEKLSEGSISHIIAVSGAHVSLVSAMFLALTTAFSKRKKYLSLLSVPFVLFFVVLTGSSASALRAAIMMILYIVAKSTLSHYDGLTSLFFAAFIILLINPFSAFSLGFILSFSAVLGILLFAEPLKKLFSFLKMPFLSSILSVTISAQIFTMITLCLSFGRFPFISLLANTIAVPLIPLIMASGYISLIISFIFPSFNLIAYFTEVFISICIGIADFTGKIPLANIYPVFGNSFMPWLIFLIFIAFCVSLILFRHIKASVLSAVLLSVLLILNAVYPVYFGEVSFHFTDVGHGDLTFVFNKDTAILIDCQSPEDRLIKDTILPILRQHGQTDIDAVFLSEYDPFNEDVTELIKSYPVSAIYLPENAEADALKKVANAYGTKIIFIGEGDFFNIGRISVKVPYSVKNTCSYLVSNETLDILFPGNITEAKEKQLAKVVSDIDILKAPRHGNKGSCSVNLLESTKPEAIIVSTGRNLSEDLCKRLTSYSLYSTKVSGDITVKFQNDIEIKPYKKVK